MLKKKSMFFAEEEETPEERRIRELTAALKAAQEANQMLEECLVEMAGVVYA